MQLFVSLLAAALLSVVMAGPLDTRGGRPCGVDEPCPPQWPVCIKFPSSCQSNCAGICV
jgi:hypothetical protein